MHDDIERILITEDEIVAANNQLAARITADYVGRNFTVVSVLKGSCIFASDLIRRIPVQLELAFVAASSYRSGTEAGRLDLDFLPSESEIQGRNLLLVDDILDTGRTMSALRAALVERGAAEVRTCVFLDKPERRDVVFDADYRAFEVENLFVVGYGLDYDGKYRNLPYVAALRAEVYAAATAAADPAASVDTATS